MGVVGLPGEAPGIRGFMGRENRPAGAVVVFQVNVVLGALRVAVDHFVRLIPPKGEGGFLDGTGVEAVAARVSGDRGGSARRKEPEGGSGNEQEKTGFHEYSNWVELWYCGDIA